MQINYISFYIGQGIQPAFAQYSFWEHLTRNTGTDLNIFEHISSKQLKLKDEQTQKMAAQMKKR